MPKDLFSISKQLESTLDTISTAKTIATFSPPKIPEIESMLKAFSNATIDIHSLLGNSRKSYETALNSHTESSLFSNSISKDFLAASKQFESVVGTSSISKAIDRNSIFDNQSRIFGDALKSYESAINPFKNDKSHFLTISEQIGKSLDMLTRPLGITQVSSFASSAKMLGLTDIVKSQESFLKAVGRNSIFDNQFKQVYLQTKLSDLISASNGDLITKMMESIQHQPVAVLNTDYIPSKIELVAATEVLQDSDQHSFLEIFNKLPTILQIIIFSFFMRFIDFAYDVSANIVANLATPYIQQIIEDNSKKSNTDKIRIIKKTPSKIIDTKIDTSHLRFITAKNGLNVRSAPSTKQSKIKDTIRLGKIVEVLDKRKNWVKISYKIDDKVIKGWVFTRYTKRFDQ